MLSPYQVLNRVQQLAGSGQPVFNVRDFGAKTDGTTNDAVAILEAIEAAVDVGGGRILFPRGTTKISSDVSKDVGVGVQGTYIFEGEGSASKILMTDGVNPGLSLGNFGIWCIRDLAIVGTSVGATSDDSVESTGWYTIGGNGHMFLMERVLVLGLASSAEQGIVNSGAHSVHIKDCIFGGNAATHANAGVVKLTDPGTAVFDNCTFPDYHVLDGVTYNKVSVVPGNSCWIRIDKTLAGNGMSSPEAVVIRNSRFDENTDTCLININGNSDYSTLLENVSFNGGITVAGFPAVKATSLHKLTVRGMWAGYNVTPYSSIIATDVETVDIDVLRHDAGATDIQLLGTTKRLKLRNAQDVTITNTAGAFIDADQSMPTTASAAALAPKGKVTHVTGTTNITSITTTNLRPGDEFTLIFDDVLTVTAGNNLAIAGNFATTAGDALTLVYDGTNCVEKCRSVN